MGYQIGEQRCCIGVWLAPQRRRQPCPFPHPILPPDTQAQCAACAMVDPGKMLARNATVDDGRDYALYLAWFGPGLIKVGLTAAERGTDRLAEQGALAFTWLGRGRLPAVRAGEQRISASGLAAERHRRRAKLAAWWRLPDRHQRQQEVRTAYRRIIGTVPWPPGLGREACDVIDQVELFGLDALPPSCQEITALSSGAVLSGTVRCAIGRDVLLDTPEGPLLADARLLAGWLLQPTTAAPTGLNLRVCDYAQHTNTTAQSSLF